MEKAQAKKRWVAQCTFEKQWSIGFLLFGFGLTLPIGISGYMALTSIQTYFLLALAGISLFRTLQGGYLTYKVRRLQSISNFNFNRNYTEFLENEQSFYLSLVTRLEQQINIETLGFILGMLLLFAGLVGPLSSTATGIGGAMLLQTTLGIIFLAIRKWRAAVYCNEMGFQA